MTQNNWLWIILFIIIVIVATLLIWKQSQRIGFLNQLRENMSSIKIPKTGASEQTYDRLIDDQPYLKTGGESDLSKKSWEMILPYVDECGSQNITKYLHDFWNISKDDQTRIKAQLRGDDFAQVKPQNKRYVALLVQHVIDEQIIVDEYDFIRQSSLSYKSFCPAGVAQLLIEQVHPYGSSSEVAIKDLVDVVARSERGHVAQSTKSSAFNILTSKRIYKIKKKYANKSITALKKALTQKNSYNKDTMFEPDLVAIGPLVQDAFKQVGARTVDVGDLTRQLQTMKLLQTDVRGINDLDDLIRVLKGIKPVDLSSYLRGKRDTETMFSRSSSNQPEIDRLRREKTDLKKELDKNQESLRKARSDLDECRKTVNTPSVPTGNPERMATLEQLVRDYEAMVANLESRIQSAKDQLNVLQRDNDALLNEAARLSQELDACQAKLV